MTDTLRDAIRYRLPDLVAPFPPPPRRADWAGLRARTCRWGERHGVISLRGRGRLLGSNLLDLGGAMLGGADPGRASVLLDWFLWMLLLDDRVDNGPWAEQDGLAAFAVAVAEATRPTALPPPIRPPDPAAAEPMSAVLANDLWPRTAALGGLDWQRRFTRHLAEHLAAQRESVRLRGLPDAVLPESAYAPLRRALFGADVFFDLIEVLDGPESEPNESTQRLRECAADAIAWTNDVYSLEKDLGFGESANLVLVLRNELDLSWQQAVDAAEQAIMRRTKEFERLAAQAESSFPRRLGETIRASLDWHRDSSRYRRQQAIPGPALDLVDSARTVPSLLWPDCEHDPYAFYALLRNRFPLFYDEPIDTWLLSRYEDVRLVLTDPRFNSANYVWQLAPVVGPTIMQMDGPEHSKHRAVITPAFLGKALAGLRVEVQRITDDLVAGVLERLRHGPVDLVEHFTRLLPHRTVISVLGLPPADEAHFLRWFPTQISFLANDRQDPSLFARGRTVRAEFSAYLDDQIAQRRRNPGPDLLSNLCQATVDGQPLADELIRGFCANLVGAGSESTDKAMASYLVNLLENPLALNEVRADPAEVTPRAWAESLRRNPPFHVVSRQTSEAVELPIGRIPAGATVGCVVGSANRDPVRFPDPDAYDLTRFAEATVAREFTARASQLSLGAGRHFCLGARLSLVEAEIGVGTLLRALPTLRWAPGFTPREIGRLVRAPAELLVVAP
ncbi:cytochrome P450 [Crossiella cryophila]|uniref:Pulcherriminic acid synthase n=1 Tax=Crossiella cryophila TaxID=43355 RepID=A0A7W7FWS3_9PSEU|nr:cytochrome P450 [Crossiella cryophila]MBB4679898.1 pulcherriminic acid synthase [Crossiella cryophila]